MTKDSTVTWDKLPASTVSTAPAYGVLDSASMRIPPCHNTHSMWREKEPHPSVSYWSDDPGRFVMLDGSILYPNTIQTKSMNKTLTNVMCLACEDMASTNPTFYWMLSSLTSWPTSSTRAAPSITPSTDSLSWEEAASRLLEYADLPSNWDEYDSDPIAPDAIKKAYEILYALRSTFVQHIGDSYLPSNLVPLRNGGLQFEWYRGDSYLEIEVDSSGYMNTLVATKVDGLMTKTRKKNVTVWHILFQLAMYLLVIPIWSSSL